MKIAMIGQKYIPSREGGVEIVVERLSSLLAKKRNEVTIFNRKRTEYPLIHEYKGCKVENIFTINKKSFDAIIYAFFSTIRAKKMARHGEFDVLHYHAEGPCFFLNLLPKKKRRKYKIVVTIHGLDWQRSKWGRFASWIIKNSEKRIAKYADEIIVLSPSIQKYFQDTYARTTHLIPNGIDEAHLLPAKIIKEKFGLFKNSYVLFVGRLVPEKGLNYLLDAWKMAKEESKSSKTLVIAGGNSHDDEYYNHVVQKAKIDSSILLTGYVEGDELKELYSNAAFFVLPSDVEGMPMALLEAISYGNRCLVSSIPENLAVIDEDDYSFIKGSSKDLADKLVKLLSEPDSRRTHTVNLRSWDSVVNETMKVYSDDLK
jgi:glycosyltransferase involved in cell wall biosynthesis